jgi:hypothetical protein
VPNAFSDYAVITLNSKGEFAELYQEEFETHLSGDVQGGAVNIDESTATLLIEILRDTRAQGKSTHLSALS